MLNRMKTLIAQLLKANAAYYGKDDPIMTDLEYDRLYSELEQLEQETGIILASSPTQRVSGEVLDSLTAVAHTKPMLSADKTKSTSEIFKFIGGQKVVISWKLDGLTLVLRYEGGKLAKAITRGDGLKGEDVTHTVRVMGNVPLTIPCTEPVEVRGEGIISWQDFQELNETLGEVYSHPRNLAAGSIRKLDANESKRRRLEFLAFDLISENLGGSSKWENLRFLAQMGFTTVGYSILAADASQDAVEQAVALYRPEEYAFPVDGLIFEYDDLAYGNIHDGVNMTVHRMTQVEDDLKEQYQEIAGDLLHISKQLQKSVLQQMRDSRRGGKQTGLLMGRRLDIHALSRNDGRVFYKNALPNEIPALCVGLLLDESGSMCSCDRATYARATAIILYDFCHALGIPVMVYGHSTGAGVDLYSYAEFDAIDQDDRYRLMDISARDSNRDGATLRYVAERLTRRTEDVKLLMLVSDGQPADTGYYGTAAEEDLRGVKQEYQRKGVLFVAAAIGNDKENIERIYGDSFLDISDLNKLPVKLAGIIKRFIRL